MEHKGSRKLVSSARSSRVPRLEETFVPATGIPPSPSPSSSGVNQQGGTTASSSSSFRRQFPSTFGRKNKTYEANICRAKQESIEPNKVFGAWEKHTGKFGTKMLKKLGYEEGKGLGKELKGELEPISLPHQPRDIFGEEDKGKKYFGIGYKG